MMNKALLVVATIEALACVCDPMIGWTCNIHELILDLRGAIVDMTVDADNRKTDLAEEVAHLTATLEDIRYKIDIAFDAY